MSVEARRVPGSDPVARELVEAMVAEVGALYEPGLPMGSSATPVELSPPGGGFVVVWEHERAIAGGGVKRLDGRTCEIKRMYVAPDVRGRGVGRALLAALEDLARDLGYAVARLDTGVHQPGARRMYERAGYAAVPDYNGNRYAAYWGEKRLAAAADERRAGGDAGTRRGDRGPAGGGAGRAHAGPGDREPAGGAAGGAP